MNFSQPPPLRCTLRITFRFASAPQNTWKRIRPHRKKNASLNSFRRVKKVPNSPSTGIAYFSAYSSGICLLTFFHIKFHFAGTSGFRKRLHRLKFDVDARVVGNAAIIGLGE